MLLEYVVTYLIVDYFCLFFSVFLFFQITIDMGTEREVRSLRALIIVFCVYLFVDAIWALGVNGFLPMTPAAVGIMENFAILLMTALSFCWFVFAEMRIGAGFMASRRSLWISAIPLAIVVLMYATTRFTGLIYFIGPDASFEVGPANLAPMVVFLMYTVFATGHALLLYFHEKSRAMRRKYLTLAAFAFAPLVCGIIDMVLHGMPIMAIAVFSALLLVFLAFQSSRINTDALTGLNNRRRAEEYIDEQISSLSDSARFAVFMVDVDYFKDINDAYGHGEGDHALIIIANGLRRAIGDHHGLVARWGGDEFVFATYLKNDEAPEEVEDVIRTQIDAVSEQENLSYAIKLSIGCSLARRDKSLAETMAEADRGLYGQKDTHHETSDNGLTPREIYPL